MSDHEVESTSDSNKADDQLVEALLVAAGLRPEDRVLARLSTPGSTNVSYLVHIRDRTLVARRYAWPYGETDDLERQTKEAWLLDHLGAHGVPVPRPVAVASLADRCGLLLEYVDGITLGEAATVHTPEQIASAWYDTGAVLRRIHACPPPPDGQGVIVGTQVRPFAEGSWAAWQEANAFAHASTAAARDPSVVDSERIRTLFRQARPLIERQPTTLLHNDAHPWNVLVRDHPVGWRCVAVLDWEFAWVGDPAWDLVRMDVFRVNDIGATPVAFFDGYQSESDPLVCDLYRLAIMLWMSNQAAEGDDGLLPTYRAAAAYLEALPRTLTSIELRLRARSPA